MADEFLRQQDPFAGSEIQDTDLFWISVDNGDTTFSTYKITGADLKELLPNIYTADGTIGASTTRIVTINDASGQLDIKSSKTKLSINGSSALLERYDSGSPLVVRRINMTATELRITSNKIMYDNYQVYQGTGVTVDATGDNLQLYTPVTASNFTVQVELKGYCPGTNQFHFARIEGVYKTVAGVPSVIDLTNYNPSAEGMSSNLSPLGTQIALSVTGVSAQVCNWTWVTKVF